MGGLDVQGVKKTLTAAGIELYRVQGSTLHIAERVRLHIMDSGIRVVMHESEPTFEVRFTARAQRCDFGSTEPQLLFERVRQTLAPGAEARGFTEEEAKAVDVTDPVDKTRLLDVWYEVTYAKRVADVEAMLDEVRWALGLEKYVQ